MKTLSIIPLAFALTLCGGCASGDDYAPSTPATASESRMAPKMEGPSGSPANTPAAAANRSGGARQ